MFLVGIIDYRTFYKSVGSRVIWTRNPFRLVPFFIFGSNFYLKCVLADDPFQFSLAEFLWTDRTASALSVF